MEANFVATTSAVQEGFWLMHFLYYLGVATLSMCLVTIFSDNQATIAYTMDSKYHSKIKHIHIKFNFMREVVQ